MKLTNAQRQFLDAQRVGHLATADAGGVPHVTPVCYASVGTNIYITIDEKPKRRQTMPLKRLRNIAENRTVRFVVDRYDDQDWSRLCWLMLRGQADILPSGDEHDEAQRLLRARYPQLREMAIERHPVIAIRVEHATSWGSLETSRL
jgi:PPOX class probable F420-dependent enzyme